MNRIHQAERAVAVSAGAFVGEAVPEAAHANVGHAHAGAIDGDETVDPALERVVEERLRAAQVAEAFFADVRHKGDGAISDHLRLVQGADHADDDRQAAAVVADAGTLQPRSVLRHADVRLGREHGVEMGGEDEMRFRTLPGALAENIADGVDADVLQTELREDGLELEPTFLLAK